MGITRPVWQSLNCASNFYLEGLAIGARNKAAWKIQDQDPDMAQIDDLLGALGAQTPPPSLADIDAGVMRGLAARRESAAARRGMMTALAVAAVVGVAGAIVPAAPAQAEPLFGVPAGAPSHLLAD